MKPTRLIRLLLAGAGIYLGLYFLHGVLQMAVDQLQVAPHAAIVSNGVERETHRMAMRYQVYSSIPDRYGLDFFHKARTDPTVAKLFSSRGKPPYGGQYLLDAFAAHGFGTPRSTNPSAAHNNWTVLWTQDSQTLYLHQVENETFAEMVSGSKIHNHCTLINYAGDKCKLGSHLDRLRTHLPTTRLSQHGALFAGLPPTYDLTNAESRRRFDSDARAQTQVHMMKPCVASGATGQGLYPAGTTVADLPNKGRFRGVLQEYVNTPFLYNRHKFHLRLYVLVTSYKPMRLRLFRQGLLLRASSEYHRAGTSSSTAFGDAFDEHTHLTNSKVNK
jgi:hypothetical protein